MTARVHGCCIGAVIACLATTIPMYSALEHGRIATTHYFGAAPDQTTIAGPVTSVVGPGVELSSFGVTVLVNGQPTPGVVSIDFSDTNILITLLRDQPFGYFDLLRFADADGTMPDFTGVTINPATNWAGFTASDVRADSDVIDVNLTGLRGLRGQRISLDVAALPAPLPSPWTSRDVGVVGRSGSATYAGGTFSVHGAGADVWGTADGFHYAYRAWTGDGSIVARVENVAGTQPWTKAGVMIRQSLTAGSPHAFMLVSGGRGFAFQRRVVAGALSTHTSGGWGTAPSWVKLTRAGNAITASVSADGTRWTVVGRDTFSMAPSVFVGLAVSSHDPSQMATGTFDRVSVIPPALPTGWQSGDVGSVGTSGSASASGGTFTVRGAGADIWGSADGFHYVWRTLSGDGAIVARVATLAGSHAWTKAGVMIRASSATGSPHALMLVSRDRGLAFQRRTVAGALSTHTPGGPGLAPQWVKLERVGAVFTASVSRDGTIWTVVGTDIVSMGTNALIGLAVTNHDTSQLATATFDRITITP